MPELKLAAVYIRVSTDDQTELSPDSQLEAVRVWADKNGFVVPDQYVFSDEGISGRSAAKRPKFNEMIALAKSADHPFDAILVWKFSRFARSQEESIVYKAMLQKAGVDVISISEPLIEGPFGSLIERIIEWMDEYYSIRLSGEVKRSMTVNAERGKRQATPPYGYKKNPAGSPWMIPDEAEAQVVREVFDSYLSGVPVLGIVADLTARGIHTHRGGRIENRTVMYWLQNPAYLGFNRWTPSGKLRSGLRGSDTLIVPGDHEAIVEREVFDAVQLRIAAAAEVRRPKERPSTELKDWMGGVVRCAYCGRTLIVQKNRSFVCNGYIKGACKHRQAIRLDDLHAAVMETLRIDAEGRFPVDYTVVRSDDTERELRTLRQQAEQYDRKLSRIREAYTAGVDSLDDYRKYREALDQQQAGILARISELESRVDPSLAEATLRSSIRSALETLESADATLHQKNSTIKHLLASCVWDKEQSTLSLTYRIFI